MIGYLAVILNNILFIRYWNLHNLLFTLFFIKSNVLCLNLFQIGKKSNEAF